MNIFLTHFYINVWLSRWQQVEEKEGTFQGGFQMVGTLFAAMRQISFVSSTWRHWWFEWCKEKTSHVDPNVVIALPFVPLHFLFSWIFLRGSKWLMKSGTNSSRITTKSFSKLWWSVLLPIYYSFISKTRSLRNGIYSSEIIANPCRLQATFIEIYPRGLHYEIVFDEIVKFYGYVLQVPFQNVNCVVINPMDLWPICEANLTKLMAVSVMISLLWPLLSYYCCCSNHVLSFVMIPRLLG